MSVLPFEAVVADHGPVVLRVVRALLGPVDADDAWSETFLAALQAYPRLRPESDVRAWLVTIAHRKAVDRLRASNRAPVATGDVGASTVGVQGGFDEAVVGRDPALWAALAALPFKQRAAVAYHHVAGLPYAEVGALIGSTEVAARRSASDGLAALRRTWTREEAS